MQIKMLRNLVGVEQLGKSPKKAGIFVEAEVTHNTGIIRYVGADLEDKFLVGQKVYVGSKREPIRMDGKDIMVMEEDNVIAVVEGSDEEEVQSEVSES